MNSMRKILVCPDSFKGSLTSRKASEAIEKGLRASGFQGVVEHCELSDGGEGFASIVELNKNVKKVEITAYDALRREITAEYLIDEEAKTAFIESATTIGIERIGPQERDPFNATSMGLGVMINDSLNRGVKEIYVSLGGSAVVDAGMGMLSELGLEFRNIRNELLKGNGRELSEIYDVDAGGLRPGISGVKFHAVCDVDNPLLGERGAIRTFAIQKGVRPTDLSFFENGMINYSSRLEQKGITIPGDTNKKGAGAAGGLGYSLQTVLKADYISGIEFIKTIVGFREKLTGADLVITGEGCVDSQSLMGKVLSGVLEESKRYGVPVLSFGGKVKDRETLIRGGLVDAIEISNPELSYLENMKKSRAFQNLRDSVSRFFSKP